MKHKQYDFADDDEKPRRKGFYQTSPEGMAFDADRGVIRPVKSVEFAYPEEMEDCDRGNPLAGYTDDQLDVACDLLGGIVRWIGASKTVTSAGWRGLALAWALRPELFDEKTFTEFARNQNASKQAVNKYIAQIRKMSGGRFRAGLIRPASVGKAISAAAIGRNAK